MSRLRLDPNSSFAKPAIGAAVLGILVSALTVGAVTPVSATPACTLTQGIDFTDRPTLQSDLDASSCPTTLAVQFTSGFTLDGTALSWTGAVPLVFDGQASSTSILDGDGASGILTSSSGQAVTISDLTLTNGSATVGGALSTDANVTLSNSALTNNTATGAGGADGGGAAYVNDVTITNSTITGNVTAGGLGGGGVASNAATITNSTISSNTASAGSGGGGGLAAFGDVTVTGSTFASNSTNGNGGALTGEEVTLMGSSLVNNSASNGGGVDTASGGTAHSLVITGSTLTGNSATSAGGGAFVSSGASTSVTVTDSIVTSNSANSGQGGGIYSLADAFTVTRSTFSSNSATGNGGALRTSAVVMVVNSTLANNHSGGRGGGISGSGTWGANLKFASVLENSATTAGANIGSSVASTLTTVGSVIATSSGAASCDGVTAAVANEYNATMSGDTSCGISGPTNVATDWVSLRLGSLEANSNPTGAQTMMPGLGSTLVDRVPTATGQAFIGPNATDERGVVRSGEFWIGSAQGSGLSQTPLDGCVTQPKSIPRDSKRRLMKAGCVTSIGQRIGVSVSGSARGDVRYYALRCKVAGKTGTRATAATGYGAGIRYCKKGRMIVRAFSTPVKLRVTWFAPATSSYADYTSKRTYRN